MRLTTIGGVAVAACSYTACLAAEPDPTPTLEETVTFLNSRLALCDHLKHEIEVKEDKIEVKGTIRASRTRDGLYDVDVHRVTFSLADLSTRVATRDYVAGEWRIGVFDPLTDEPPKFEITISCRMGACIEVVWDAAFGLLGGSDRGEKITSYTFFICDDDVKEPVQKALLHAIRISGGKAPLF